MFYVLAISLCLAVLFLVLAGASLLCMPGLRLALRLAGPATPGARANLLFAARLFPLALACLITFGFALPAFLEFEPYSSGEGMGLRLMALAALGALALAGMVWRGSSILRTTRRTQREWRRHAEKLNLKGVDAPVYRVENAASLMAVAGIFRPQIFVAREITESLSPEELRAALAHEMAHVSSRDNLKQLLLKITQAPRWLKSTWNADAEWTSASEIAADQEALAQGTSVLDLSTALIKVGRLNRPIAGGEPVASHLVPSGCGSALENRVACLSEILEGAASTTLNEEGAKSTSLLLPAILALAVYVACINAILPAVHEALELLVR
jgi:Zn-dependent protease with chaperone function